MIYHDVEQNSKEWFNLRKGKFTSSTFADLFMKESTAGYQKAIYKAVFERMTGEIPDTYSNFWMERGHALEEEAKQKYAEKSYQTDLINGGFCEPDESDPFYGWIGVSPDMLIGKNGIYEGKAPAYNTLITYHLKKELPKDYHWQVHGHIFVTDREWCDFVAYHPNMKLLKIRVYRDEQVIKELKNKLEESINYAQNILKKLAA